MIFLFIFCALLGVTNIGNAAVYRRTIGGPTNLFPLTLIHLSDFHARFEETNWQSGVCKKSESDNCIGGYARIVSTIRKLKQIRSNPIYLNAGDNFSGTIWYAQGRWNITSYFLNMLKPDVMTLGNHEFDHGIAGVAPFLDAIESPIVLANVDASNEPSINGKYQSSIVINRSGRKIGIIGVLFQYTNQISNTGNLRFYDEADVVRDEAEKLRKREVDIIIVLSHSGLDVDFHIAQSAGPYIDVIVGGHSHTFLYSGKTPPGPDPPEGDYPIVVKQNCGRKVLIVHSGALSKYVGDITVYFDINGEVSAWRGNPIFMGPNIPNDPQIFAEIQPFKKAFDKITTEPIGESSEVIDATTCGIRECEMGNLLADVYRDYFLNETSPSIDVVAFVNSGGIRSSMNKGKLVAGDVNAVIPFGDTIDSKEVTGTELLAVFEYVAERLFDRKYGVSHLLQGSGMRVVFDETKPAGQQIVSLDVECRECNSTQRFRPVEHDRIYRIVCGSFLLGGGDGYKLLTESKRNYIFGPPDSDILVDYIKRNKIISGKIDGRIKIIR